MMTERMRCNLSLKNVFERPKAETFDCLNAAYGKKMIDCFKGRLFQGDTSCVLSTNNGLPAMNTGVGVLIPMNSGVRIGKFSRVSESVTILNQIVILNRSMSATGNKHCNSHPRNVTKTICLQEYIKKRHQN
jgi:hypothetical protein